jgi:GNAT superfamily N-acetyltransferase
VAERAGRFLGTVMAWRYGEDFATVGMVIVASDAQGQGVGRKLMEAMLDRLAGRTVVLNATAAGLPLYEKLGFVETGVIHQHQAIAPGRCRGRGLAPNSPGIHSAWCREGGSNPHELSLKGF